MTWNETSRYPANLSIDIIIPCRLYNSEGVAQLWRNNSFAVGSGQDFSKFEKKLL
jgi:hypothetical protein